MAGEYEDASESTADGVPTIDGFDDLVEVGRGGYSTVYAATQVDFGRRVAVKVLDFSGLEARRIEREARAVGKMTDLPNVVQAFQVVTTSDGRPALVMALMPGSMAQLIAANGPLPPADVARWATQLARALDAAHGFDLYHRDIKPQNVLISAYGDAYLADFGIAALDDMAASTATAESISPSHAPPERLTGDTENPQAGDVYSFASTLYTALTGHTPFGSADDGGVYGLLNRVMQGAVPPDPSLGPATHAVVATAMAKSPDQRHGSIGEFSAAFLAALEADAGVPAQISDASMASPAPQNPSVVQVPTGTEPDDDRTRVRGATNEASEPAADKPSRRRRLLALGALGLLICAAGLLAFWVARPGPPVLASEVAAGRAHSCALEAGGDVLCWGANWFGQLGAGSPTSPAASSSRIAEALTDDALLLSDERSNTPVRVDGLGRATAMSSGRNHTCALTADRTVSCWGSNASGQLGSIDVPIGEADPEAWSVAPVEVAGLTDVVELSAGFDSTCARRDDGTVWCWGSNIAGQLGDPTVPFGEGRIDARSTAPVQVQDLPPAVAIDAGGNHVCALHDDATASCWGANYDGQLGSTEVKPAGDGRTGVSVTPVPVQLGGIVQLSAGRDHTCALVDDATVECWGANRYGQLGNARKAGPDLDEPLVTEPVPVVRLSAVATVVAGSDASCALLRDGSVSCWGSNSHGQLGSGTAGPEEWTDDPREVAGPAEVASISMGRLHVCARTESDQVWCWGYDAAGQTGRPPGDGRGSVPELVRE